MKFYFDDRKWKFIGAAAAACNSANLYGYYLTF